MRTLVFLSAAMALGLAGCGPQAAAPGVSTGPGRFEKYCAVPGVDAAARQTVIIIDEHEITPNPAPGLIAPENLKWTKWLGRLVSAKGAAREAIFAPRERLTVLVAPKDGSEPRLMFTGCLPFFSQAEATAIAQKQGGVNSAAGAFFGSGALETAEKDSDKFRSALGAAAALAGAPDGLSKKSLGDADLPTSGLMASLRHGGLINLTDGVPRVMLYSDLSRFAAPWRDTQAARAAGLQLGSEAPLDLKRADFYVLGVGSSESADLVRQFVDAFLLSSAATLKGWSLADAPLSEPAPTNVRFFSGLVRYGAEDVPVKLRLGTTGDGKIVNSWLTVRRDFETSTPFSGEVVSDGHGGQIARSDGHGFGQLWSLNPDPAPEFTDRMAFGGLRNVELQVHPDGTVTGKVFDPLVTRIKGNPTPFISLKLTQDSHSQF